jgi:hypothetical protein
VRPFVSRTDSDDSAPATTPALREVTRYDRGEMLAAPRETDEGFLIVECAIAKPGVLEYRDATGKITRELVPPDELHRADSLDTLLRKSVTIEHPPEDVTADNVDRYGVGDVGGSRRILPDGRVVVELTIRKRDALDALRGGKREVSPGYKCLIDPTPGTHPTYGRYDAVQRQRRYNHAAITDRARGGRDIAIRTDSAEQVAPTTTTTTGDRLMNPFLVALLAAGLLSVKADRADAADKVDADLEGDPAKIAAAIKARTDAADAVGALVGETDPAKIAAAVKAKINATPAERADADLLAYANERAPLLDLARRYEVDNVDKLGNAALRKAITTKANPKARADASDAYYAAACDLLAERADDDADPWSAIKSPAADKRADRADVKPPSLAYLDRIAEQKRGA